MAARSGRILVVDDEVNARTALAELLREQGYDVETAADGFKALGKFESFGPHLVITDLQMPGMDGAVRRSFMSRPAMTPSSSVRWPSRSRPGAEYGATTTSS